MSFETDILNNADNFEADFNSLSARASKFIGVSATVSGNPATLTDAKDNIDAALLAVSALGGGILRIPRGDWYTSGNHALFSNVIIMGEGKGITRIIPNSTNPVFTHGSNVWNAHIRDLTIGGDSFVNVNGVDSNGSTTSNGLHFVNTAFQNLAIGHKVSGDPWQLAFLTYDFECVFNACNIGVSYNTANLTFRNDAYFFVGNNQKAADLIKFGQGSFGGEFAGSTYAGREQTLKQTIVKSGSASGVAQSVVTKGGVSHTVYVTLDSAVQTTAALIAAAFADALAIDPWVTSNFHFSVSGADLYLINIDREANDATMNFTIEDVTSTMVADNVTATQFYSGVAESVQALGFFISDSHGSLTFNAATIDEGFKTFLQVDGGGTDGTINFIGMTVQGAIRLNSDCRLVFTNCIIADRVVRDSSGCNAYVTINDGCRVPYNESFAGQVWVLRGHSPTNFGQYAGSGGGIIAYESNDLTGRVREQFTRRAFFNTDQASRNSIDSPIEAYNTQSQGTRQAVKFGHCDEVGNPTATYGARRSVSDYKCHFEGSQALQYKGYDFDAPITATNYINVILLSDCIINPANAFTNISDLSVNLLSGKTYFISICLVGHGTTLTDGVKIDFGGGSATPTIFGVTATCTILPSPMSMVSLTTNPITVSSWSSVEKVTNIFGVIQVNAGGTFIIRATANTYTAQVLTFKAGSFIRLVQLD